MKYYCKLSPEVIGASLSEPHTCTYPTAVQNPPYNRRAERAPHLSYSGEKSSSYIYICFLYIYIYIYVRTSCTCR